MIGNDICSRGDNKYVFSQLEPSIKDITSRSATLELKPLKWFTYRGLRVDTSNGNSFDLEIPELKELSNGKTFKKKIMIVLFMKLAAIKFVVLGILV